MGVSATVNAIVLGDEELMHDIIIGRDYLDQKHVLLIKRQDDIILRTLPNMKYNDIEETMTVSVNIGFTNDEVVIGEIQDADKVKLLELLNKSAECVSTNKLRKTDLVAMKIKCVSDVLIVYRPYRMPEVEKAIARDLIQVLSDNNIVRESCSPYASLIMLVKKKTDDYRLVVDYRRLNAITIKDRYPLPRIEDEINKLGGNKYFTGLDLAQGFYQVPMEEESVEKTAFVTPDGHYEFLRMLFGLSNSPAVFQRLINKALGELKDSIAFPYIDDIIIPSVTVKEGLERLELVLIKLRDNNLTLRLSKCKFLQTSIDYLGQEISEKGVKPGKRKIEAVLQTQAPGNVKQVRQFVGLASYFRKFVANFSIMVETNQIDVTEEDWILAAQRQDEDVSRICNLYGKIKETVKLNIILLTTK